MACVPYARSARDSRCVADHTDFIESGSTGISKDARGNRDDSRRVARCVQEGCGVWQCAVWTCGVGCPHEGAVAVAVGLVWVVHRLAVVAIVRAAVAIAFQGCGGAPQCPNIPQSIPTPTPASFITVQACEQGSHTGTHLGSMHMLGRPRLPQGRPGSDRVVQLSQGGSWFSPCVNACSAAAEALLTTSLVEHCDV